MTRLRAVPLRSVTSNLGRTGGKRECEASESRGEAGEKAGKEGAF